MKPLSLEELGETDLGRTSVSSTTVCPIIGDPDCRLTSHLSLRPRLYSIDRGDPKVSCHPMERMRRLVRNREEGVQEEFVSVDGSEVRVSSGKS